MIYITFLSLVVFGATGGQKLGQPAVTAGTGFNLGATTGTGFNLGAKTSAPALSTVTTTTGA